MKRFVLAPLALVLSAAALPAAAQSYGYDDPYGEEAGYAEDYGYGGGYDEGYAPGHDPRHGGVPAGYGTAPGAPVYDEAVVLSVDPIVERGRPVLRQQCWREPVPGYARHDPYARPRTSGNGALLGAIVGGVLGNSVGGGDGRQAATAVGAVVGGMVGNSMERQARERDARYHEARYGDPRVAEVERCRTVRVADGDSRVVGYRVAYEYAGRTFETVTDYHPGSTLRVRVDVTPEG